MSPAIGEESAIAMRVADYLRACGVPDPLLYEWLPQLMQYESDLPFLLQMTQQRFYDWLRDQLVVAGLNPNDQQTVWLAQASLREWRSGLTLSHVPDADESATSPLHACCTPPLPPTAPLEMVTQTISLRSPVAALTHLCRRCLPLGTQLKERLRNL